MIGLGLFVRNASRLVFFFIQFELVQWALFWVWGSVFGLGIGGTFGDCGFGQVLSANFSFVQVPNDKRGKHFNENNCTYYIKKKHRLHSENIENERLTSRF